MAGGLQLPCLVYGKDDSRIMQASDREATTIASRVVGWTGRSARAQI